MRPSGSASGHPDEGVEVCVPASTFSKTVNGMTGQFAEREQAVDAACPGRRSNLAMQILCIISEFFHVPEHQPALSGKSRQKLRRRNDRQRVGVVAVVKQGRTVHAPHRFETTTNRTDTFECSTDLLD